MRSPRFRLRTLLILVALAGLGAWGVVLTKLSAKYRQQAETAKAKEDQEAEMEGFFMMAAGYTGKPEIALRAVPHAKRREHFARAKLSYQRAALYPFLPVAPDPPEPE